ncbi:citryl-CoA lyase [Ostreibacterium oceani]|uniref:citrate synthase (unknown stereospecificity) n=1 Tax=Ostreibacterium oceani TaxID=2654998 RepID=A0A6N7F3N3_9GAMM|nr:citryl-CoA lyase [Ostreibacterium oceani]
MQPCANTDVSDWWRSAIIDMSPGIIRFRGYPIEQLIGNVSFVDMIWLMTRGELPSPQQAELLEGALVAAVDHGPQAPSIGIARMAITCGIDLNNALGSAVNVLGDIHGGAGQQAMLLYQQIDSAVQAGQDLNNAVENTLDAYANEGQKIIPGFGHRFHPIDPRTPRLLALVQHAVDNAIVTGHFRDIALAVESHLAKRKGKAIPMNIDGVTAVIYAELGFSPALARGLFCLSRSVGILAHAWEQSEKNERLKGATPPHYRWTYDGPEPRDIAKHQTDK